MLKSERKVRIMTYTGAMVLPQNAIVMPEQEMRYVEGGRTYTRTTGSLKYKTALKAIKSARRICRGLAIAAWFSFAVIGAQLGVVGGALMVAAGGAVGSVYWGFGDAFADAQMDLEDSGYNKVKIRTRLSGLKLKVTVLKG